MVQDELVYVLEWPTHCLALPLTILLSAVPVYVLSAWVTYIYDRIINETSYEEEKLKLVYNADTCSICLDHVVSPVSLQCGHVMCLDCLETYIHVNSGALRCTLCRELITDVFSIKSSLSDLRVNIKVQLINQLVHQLNDEMNKE